MQIASNNRLYKNTLIIVESIFIFCCSELFLLKSGGQYEKK